MRRLFLICLLALGAFAGMAQAAPVADLTALARYYPDDTVLFAAVRTDDGFIETLDGVIGQMRDLLPPGTIPPFRLNMLLDQAVSELGQDSFQEVFRPWLGNTAAFGVTSFEGDGGFALALEINDREAAAAFVDRLLADSEYDTSEQDGFTIYFIPDGEGLIAINDEAAIITLQSAARSQGDDFRSLAASAAFTGTLDQLPADEYSFVTYINTPALFAQARQQMAAGGGDLNMDQMFAGFAESLGPQMLAFTILDGRSLVLDSVQTYSDTAALEAAGFSLTAPAAPVDPAFAAHIPADAPLVLMGTELNTSITAGFQNIRVMGRMLQEQARALPDSRLDDDARWLRDINVGNAVVTFVNLTFSGATGLNLEGDVLPWMGGNYAAYLRLLPLPPETGVEAALDYALLVEATDTDGARALVDSLENALEQYELTYSREAIGAGSALVLAAPIQLTIPSGLREQPALQPEQDVLIAASDNLFALGSRPAVTYSLGAEGDSLVDAATFIEAQQHALDGAQQFGYLNARAFVPAIDAVITRASGRSAQDLRDARALAGLFSSGSMSVVASDSGGTVSRLVFTLARDPLEAPPPEAEPAFEITAPPTPTYVPSPTPAS